MSKQTNYSTRDYVLDLTAHLEIDYIQVDREKSGTPITIGTLEITPGS